MSSISLFHECQKALACKDIEEKPQRVLKAFKAFLNGKLFERPDTIANDSVGFPDQLEWVAPKALARRKTSQAKGRVALMHAIGHIEFNAINLALDAICRFPGLPQTFYCDWFKVAAEESYHFQLIDQYLRNHGYGYGDFPVHNGLWQMAQDTAYDPMVRMACVPRLLEARGLDVAPTMALKLQQQGDVVAAEILNIIFQDEIEHVRVGNRWYHYFCQKRGIDPLETFKQCVAQHAADFLRGPYNTNARQAAGFLKAELAVLLEMESALQNN